MDSVAKMALTVYETDNSIASCATSLFLPNFDVICGLLHSDNKEVTGLRDSHSRVIAR